MISNTVQQTTERSYRMNHEVFLASPTVDQRRIGQSHVAGIAGNKASEQVTT